MSRMVLAAKCTLVEYRRMMRETDLYPPLKALFQSQGYEVKGEVGAADIVACRGAEDPVIVEMKLRFSLALFHQAVARQAISDLVYIAVMRPTGKSARRALKDNLAMCRRLGLGLITVRGRDGFAEVHADPGPYRPRKSAKRKARLLREFARRSGDPNHGGATRHGLVTSYRQDALRCGVFLAVSGPSRGAVVARASGVAQATRIMSDNHYGWFERVGRGVYRLTEAGERGLADWGDVVPGAQAPGSGQSGAAISSRK